MTAYIIQSDGRPDVCVERTVRELDRLGVSPEQITVVAPEVQHLAYQMSLMSSGLDAALVPAGCDPIQTERDWAIHGEHTIHLADDVAKLLHVGLVSAEFVPETWARFVDECAALLAAGAPLWKGAPAAPIHGYLGGSFPTPETLDATARVDVAAWRTQWP